MTMPRFLNLNVVIVVLACLAAYANTLGNGFVYDDHIQILQNPWLTSPKFLGKIFSSELWAYTDSSVSPYYRPLMHVANLLVVTLFGTSGFWLHLTNLLLHAASSVLLLLVLQRLAGELSPQSPDANFPLLAALLFAVFPANNEAVAWLGSSADLLYVLFCMLSFYCFLSLPGAPAKRWLVMGLAMLSFFAATLSKETAFFFPGVLLVVDAARGRLASHGGLRRLAGGYAGLLLVAVVSLLLRFAVLGVGAPFSGKVAFSPWELVRAFSFYLGRLIWPFRHNFFPEFAAVDEAGLLQGVILPLVILVLGVGLAWWQRRNRWFWFAAALVLVPLLPALANSTLGKPVAERYLYFPSMGAAVLLALGLQALVKNRRYRTIACGVLLAAFISSNLVRNADFSNDVTLWRDTIEKSPHSAKAMGWYATALFAEGRLQAAIDSTSRAIELGLYSANSLLDLVDGLVKSGRGSEVGGYFERVLELNPENPDAYLNVGLAYAEAGNNRRALQVFEQAYRWIPDNPVLNVYLARCYVQFGRFKEALRLFDKAFSIDPAARAALQTEYRQLQLQAERRGQ